MKDILDSMPSGSDKVHHFCFPAHNFFPHSTHHPTFEDYTLAPSKLKETDVIEIAWRIRTFNCHGYENTLKNQQICQILCSLADTWVKQVLMPLSKENRKPMDALPSCMSRDFHLSTVQLRKEYIHSLANKSRLQQHGHYFMSATSHFRWCMHGHPWP